MMGLRKRKKDTTPDDDRSFAVALRLELVAQRMAAVADEAMRLLEEEEGGEPDAEKTPPSNDV